MSSNNQSSNSQSNSSAGSQGNSSAKAPIKVDLSSSVEELLSGNKAVLTFSFSSLPLDFTLSDIKVTNGVVTNLVQSLSSPNTYTADFIGGVTDKSGMSTIKLNGSYYDSSWIDGTPSNTITIKNLPTTTMVPFPTVGFTSNNASVTEGNSGTTDINFTVQLSKSSTEFITVNYTTEQKTFGTAKANLDYIPVTSTVVFAPGETSKTVTVKVIGDTIGEGTESFYVDLTSATGASIVINGAEGYRNNWAVGNIKNDDVSATPTVGFTSNNISVVEGNSGFTSANFTVQLSKSSTETVTVNYTTEQKTFGTAKANLDYVPVTSSVVFAPGETSKTVTVKVIGDTIGEGTESFYVDLTSATGASIVINGAEGYRNNWSVANITNDDVSATPTVGFTSNNMTMTEGNSGNTNANFTVQLSKSSTETVTVNYTTEQKTFGTAKANLDYVPVTGSVVFAPGETSKVISVQVIGDTIYEGKESFYVDLTSATGASIVINGAEGYRNNWSVANITNDDVFSVVAKTDKGIFGTTSQDVIGGTAAADYIYGKGGSDIITGFSGNDTFVFSKMDAAKFIKDAPQITDFKNGFDMIGLQGLEFGDLRVAQDTCLHSSDTVISLSTGEVLAVLIGINQLAIDVTDFVSMV